MKKITKTIIIILVFVLTGVIFYYREIRGATIKTTATIPVNYQVEVRGFDLYVNTNAQNVYINEMYVQF